MKICKHIDRISDTNSISVIDTWILQKEPAYVPYRRFGGRKLFEIRYTEILISRRAFFFLSRDRTCRTIERKKLGIEIKNGRAMSAKKHSIGNVLVPGSKPRFEAVCSELENGYAQKWLRSPTFVDVRIENIPRICAISGKSRLSL